MSREVYEEHQLHVTRFAGPGGEGEPDDRARWQITPMSGDYAILDRDELRSLALAILEDSFK